VEAYPLCFEKREFAGSSSWCHSHTGGILTLRP